MKNSALEENQMDFLHSDQNGDPIEAEPIEQIFPQDNDEPYERDEWDHVIPEPESLPRIGDEFQVEIPQLTGKPGHSSHSRGRANTENSFLTGLPLALIPFTGKATNIRTFSDVLMELENEPWSDVEKASFLLGLYIFQKDFVKLRTFVETKEMPAILSFYYGEFYGSDEYYRWSECRKTKSKKCVYGQRIFSGSRQQELLSRINPTLSRDTRRALLQVSKDFGDEKMSLDEYVSSLKILVGMSILVEAVAIGKGKRDLTRMVSDLSRSNKAKAKLPLIPSGKACSNLTTSEIIKFIGGDYRLSKGRANDLFWEAVWPRLLARGWHSEQPDDQGYLTGLKNSLVFLFPGVKKFSRRKLVKGNHYFDSVTDVLSKVAKEPELIELDAEDVDCERKSENDENDPPPKPVKSYLQPPTPKRKADVDVITFTIVDTSLAGSEIRELRGLPSGISNFLSLGHTDDILDDVSDEDDEVKKTTISSKKLKPIGKNGDVKLQLDYIDVKSKVSRGKTQPKKVPKSQPRKKTEEPKLVPSSKKKSGPTSISENVISGRSSRNKAGSPPDRMMIDLNEPAELDGGILAIEWKTEESEVRPKQKDNNSWAIVEAEEPVVSSRRQSTRNRPPTAKALEALANGFLTVDRKRKGKSNDLSDEIPSRVLRRSRKARTLNDYEGSDI